MWRHLPIFKTLRGPTSIRIFSPLFKFFFSWPRDDGCVSDVVFGTESVVESWCCVRVLSHVVLDSRFDFQRIFELPF